MERVLASFRELVQALGLQNRAEEIEADAVALLAAHDSSVEDGAIPGQRPENKALAICYIAANHVLIPERVSYEDMMRAAAKTPTWRNEPVPGKNGMTKIVKRFARRICPIEHDPEIVEKANSSFTICAQCHYILRTGGPVRQSPDVEPIEVEVDTPTPGRAGLHGYAADDSLELGEPLEDTTPAQPIDAREGPGEADGVVAGEAAEAGALEGDVAGPLDAEEVLDGEPEGETGGTAPISDVTPEIRKKWLASAVVQAKKTVKQYPVLKVALPGAMVLVKRCIDGYINSEKVLGSLVQKIVRMALLHESKVQNLPVTTKDLNVQPSDYLKFLAASSTTVAQPASTSDASIVERALDIVAAHSRQPVDEETRERITRFQAVARRKLMGFSPAMAASVIAFIEIARHDPSVVLSKVASIAGINTSSLYNATGRFLEKIGRSGDPAASLNERVVAAFPPRDK
ncbi:MAG: hypothetical protein JW839_14685 [Candidatus Lokiarchaeota archaeon]|nr:hypothetical protein [Candidatus Lokiarchaeota archaeon]